VVPEHVLLHVITYFFVLTQAQASVIVALIVLFFLHDRSGLIVIEGAVVSK
jgi:hypothetical protein